MNKIPNSVNEKILSEIKGRLQPKLSLLIGKVFLVHLLTALITLSVCPQFGFKLLKLPINLMYSFMFFGMPFCNFMCGLFFTATSMVVAVVVLGRDELRALRYHKMLVAATLILSSVGFFGVMNPGLFLECSLLWLMGAILGIIVTLEIHSRLFARI
jgi:hypothetical protein